LVCGILTAALADGKLWADKDKAVNSPDLSRENDPLPKGVFGLGRHDQGDKHRGGCE
jgi:hypothetical protein